MRLTRTWTVAAVCAAAALGVAGCGGDDEESAGSDISVADTNVSGEVSMTGIWSGKEEENFQAVLDAFQEKYPNVTVKYTSAGDNTPTVLSTAVEGGSPPDVAAVGQPGLVKDFQAKGALKPIGFAEDTVSAQYPEDLVELGKIDNQLYAFLFKAANKSTVWYNSAAFEEAGVTPPSTWEEFLSNAETLGESGTPAYSIAGADGWTLTDLFENIYIRQAGPEKYDQLTDHEIPWTDESVKNALTAMGQILGDTDNVLGGSSGALQTEFPRSVSNVFVDPAKAAQVIEGDFVPGVVDTDLEPGTGFDQFPFPSIGGSGNAVVGGGDMIIAFNDTPAVQALVEYLASKEAQEVRAKLGGFSSANKELDPAVYPDDITRATATAIAEAETFRFDMSDLQPVDFGGTAGQGSWKAFQDFLADPDDVEGAQRQLENAAKRAYGDN